MAYFDELPFSGLAKNVTTIERGTGGGATASGGVTFTASFSKLAGVTVPGGGSISFPQVDFSAVTAVRIEIFGLTVDTSSEPVQLQLWRSDTECFQAEWAEGRAVVKAGSDSGVAKLGMGVPVRNIDAGILVTATGVQGHWGGSRVDRTGTPSGLYTPRLVVGSGSVGLRALRLTVWWKSAGFSSEKVF